MAALDALALRLAVGPLAGRIFDLAPLGPLAQFDFIQAVREPFTMRLWPEGIEAPSQYVRIPADRAREYLSALARGIGSPRPPALDVGVPVRRPPLALVERPRARRPRESRPPRAARPPRTPPRTPRPARSARIPRPARDGAPRAARPARAPRAPRPARAPRFARTRYTKDSKGRCFCRISVPPGRCFPVGGVYGPGEDGNAPKDDGACRYIPVNCSQNCATTTCTGPLAPVLASMVALLPFGWRPTPPPGLLEFRQAPPARRPRRPGEPPPPDLGGPPTTPGANPPGPVVPGGAGCICETWPGWLICSTCTGSPKCSCPGKCTPLPPGSGLCAPAG